jgi:hypothetical protein
MRVKMLSCECGPDGNFAIGEHRDVADDHGRQLIAGNHAVMVTPETAIISPEETAVLDAPETRGRKRK